MKKKNNHNLLLPYPIEKNQPASKPVHVQLEETLAERKRILAKWEHYFLGDECGENDIHATLAKTIAQYKKEKQVWDQRLFAADGHKTSIATNKQAA